MTDNVLGSGEGCSMRRSSTSMQSMKHLLLLIRAAGKPSMARSRPHIMAARRSPSSVSQSAILLASWMASCRWARLGSSARMSFRMPVIRIPIQSSRRQTQRRTEEKLTFEQQLVSRYPLNGFHQELSKAHISDTRGASFRALKKHDIQQKDRPCQQRS